MCIIHSCKSILFKQKYVSLSFKLSFILKLDMFDKVYEPNIRVNMLSKQETYTHKFLINYYKVIDTNIQYGTIVNNIFLLDTLFLRPSLIEYFNNRRIETYCTQKISENSLTKYLSYSTQITTYYRDVSLGPSIVEYENDILKKEIFHQFNFVKTIKTYYCDKRIRSIQDNNKILEYYPNGKLMKQSIKENNKYVDGWSERGFYENGTMKYKRCYYCSQLHNLSTPAEIWYYRDGKIEFRCYYQNGKIHRDNAPAMLWYNREGNITKEEYYRDGYRV